MTIKEISLLTGNLQPKGHPFYVDAETLAGAERLLADRPLAAHLSHANAASDRLGTAIGFFRGIYRDGLQLRAKTFEFLDSFKANFKAQYDNLAELATKFPEQFGVSLHLKYQPVWVMGDGSEVAAKVVDGKLIYEKPGISDYTGMLEGGRYIAEEAKSTKSEHLLRSVVKKKQAEHLEFIARGGGLALLVVEFRTPATVESRIEIRTRFAVPWLQVPWKVLRSAESVSAEDLCQWAVDSRCYLLKFHPCGVSSTVGHRRVYARE